MSLEGLEFESRRVMSDTGEQLALRRIDWVVSVFIQCTLTTDADPTAAQAADLSTKMIILTNFTTQTLTYTHQAATWTTHNDPDM